MQPVLIYATFADKTAALAMAKELLAEKLVACANILPRHTAVYEWDGALQEAEEVILLAKTSTARQAEAIAHIAARHAYECPCVLSLPVDAAHGPFRDWIFSQIGD